MRTRLTAAILLPLASLPGALWAQGTSQRTEQAGTTLVQGTAPSPRAPLPLPRAKTSRIELYDNGDYINSPGTGPNGADESILQTNALGLITLGFGHQVSEGYRIADDFTVPQGATWRIDTIDLFAYQTGSSTASTITAVNLRIWDGIPGATGSSIVFGDDTTNRLIETVWDSSYRVADTSPGNADRPVMRTTAHVGLTLGPGTYWLDWQSAGSLSSGPWAVPITITGEATTGDGLQYGDGEWTAAIDDGTGAAQGFPFVLYQDEAGPVVDFRWWPEQPRRFEPVRFAGSAEGSPLAWRWDFGDDRSSILHNPVHVYTQPGEYLVTLTVSFATGAQTVEHSVTVQEGEPECGDGVCDYRETAWGCPEDCGLPEDETGRTGGADRRSFVPAAVGGVGGVGSTFWLTEGMVFNPNEEEAAFVIDYVADQGGLGLRSAGPFTLAGETALYFENLVSDLFATTENGSLRLDADVPLMFDTRTYNQTDQGTFGQAITATRLKTVLGPNNGKVVLIGLSENASFRTNVLVQEIAGEETTVELEVFNGDGTRVGDPRSLTVQPYTKLQRRLSQLGFAGLTHGYGTFKVQSGGRVVCLASVVDAETGDATTIDAVHPRQVLGSGKGLQQEHYLIAVIASTPGVNDTLWRSSLDLMNPDTTSQSVTLEYRPSPTTVAAATVDLSPGQQLSWEDAVGELFSATGDGGGSLHVYAQTGLIISSRCYNLLGSGGTLGQSVPGLAKGDLAQEGEVWVLNKLKNNDDFRCNVGFSEFSGDDVEVNVTLFDVSGASRRGLGSKSYWVTALSNRQVNRIFEDMEIEGEYREAMAYATVTGSGRVYVYASVVDNLTGDATTVLAKMK